MNPYPERPRLGELIAAQLRRATRLVHRRRSRLQVALTRALITRSRCAVMKRTRGRPHSASARAVRL